MDDWGIQQALTETLEKIEHDPVKMRELIDLAKDALGPSPHWKHQAS